eukprot:TRINITY_DN4667_c0_g1_i1.p1 TRINITY_DN4667_c0_g1~~TRINITY_DN4667_c0_g1_i1.p1  ORF type:complete len:108 (+),score=39.45 TRINITY_DN4667_c0_g1_i1:224-547(+)
MSGTDDSDRLIQEVLSELGWDEDPKTIANKVRQLDQGLPAEDEFTAICNWLGRARLVHKLDQHQAPVASRNFYQVPDCLLYTSDAADDLLCVDLGGRRIIKKKKKQK